MDKKQNSRLSQMDMAGMQGPLDTPFVILRYFGHLLARMGRLRSVLDIPLEMGVYHGNCLSCILGRTVLAVFSSLYIHHARNKKAV